MLTTRSVTTRWLVVVLIAIGLGSALAIGLFNAQSPADPGGKAKIVDDDASAPAEREAGEKRTTGNSIPAARLVVEKRPTLSALNAGFDQERLWGAYDNWEPAIAVDPIISYVYQLTTRYDGPAPHIIFRRSKNGGATWEADKVLTPYSKSHNDPQIEVANDGTIYAAWLNGYVPGVKFIKSTNRGDTWSSPIAITSKSTKPNWSDKPILAISPNRNPGGKYDVYIAFNASDSYVVASRDSGATFSKPIKTNNDTRYWFHTGGAVAPDGTVYFAAVDYSQDYTGDSHINVMKSTNSGASWTTTRVATSRQMPDCTWAAGCTLGFFGPSAALAIDKVGKLMVAYNAGDDDGKPQKMWVRTSTDGVNWSSPTEVSNGVGTVNNAFPALAAGPTPGDFRVAWQDDRNSSTSYPHVWNTWYRSTTPDGRDWNAAVRLSDLDSGAPYKVANGYAFPYGDYFEMAVDSSGIAHIIWGEGSSDDGPGGTWYTRGK